MVHIGNEIRFKMVYISLNGVCIYGARDAEGTATCVMKTLNFFSLSQVSGKNFDHSECFSYLNAFTFENTSSVSPACRKRRLKCAVI